MTQWTNSILRFYIFSSVEWSFRQTKNEVQTFFFSVLSHLPNTSTPLVSRTVDMIKASGTVQAPQQSTKLNGSVLAGTIASSSTMVGAGAASSLAKPLLPFSITPPRQNGPSEAERKIEALTKQLEEELEKEEESEYFGEFKILLLTLDSVSLN